MKMSHPEIPSQLMVEMLITLTWSRIVLRKLMLV